MNVKKEKYSSQNSVKSVLKGIWHNFVHELKTTFLDRGVVIMFILGPLVYPLLYCTMYFNENLVNVPVGVVDNSHSSLSRKLVHNIDATQGVKIYSNYSSMAEAKQAFENRDIHGII